MFFRIFFFVCLTVYIVSIIETIGSYILSTKEHGNYSTFYLWVSIFIPPIAPIFAWAIFSTAEELYDKKKPNTHQVDESFYGYLLHGCKTINVWSERHGKPKTKRRKYYNSADIVKLSVK